LCDGHEIVRRSRPRRSKDAGGVARFAQFRAGGCGDLRRRTAASSAACRRQGLMSAVSDMLCAS
jgi:hypothetical protein